MKSFQYSLSSNNPHIIFIENIYWHKPIKYKKKIWKRGTNAHNVWCFENPPRWEYRVKHKVFSLCNKIKVNKKMCTGTGVSLLYTRV